MPNFDQAFPLVLPITNTGWVKVCLVGLPGGPYILFAIDVQLFWEDFDPSQIHRHSTAFSSPQRERRPRCHLRKLTRSCNVLGMGRKIYRSKMCGSFVAVKHFMCHCKILSDAHLRMNLSRPTREMCEEFMMFQDQSLLYSALENHPISTCKWLGTQPLVKCWQLWFSRVYLPSKSMSGLGEISSIRFINRPFQANHHVTTMFIT